MSGLLNNSLFLSTAAAAAAGYQIERSLRFNSSDSAFLSRTPGSAGNRKTYTFSCWVKRSKLGTLQYVIQAYGGGTYRASLFFDTDDTLYFALGNTSPAIRTNAVFRDVSAWYHIVLAIDTTQSTQSAGMKLYVNGTQQTVTNSGTYTQNDEGWINSTSAHQISGTSGYYLDGYLADIYFLDGQALTPSSFTEVSATTGQLIPKAYTGSFGTNGFWLKFSDNSAATATTLGKDYSGNSNNWTPNNLSTSTGGPTSVAAASGALPVFNTTDTYGTVKGTGTRTDTNSASIVLALPMDGTNGGTSFGDQSAVIKGSGSAKTVTVNGNSNTSTAQSKFYGSSGLFDGTGDFLGITPTTDFALPGDFTIEAWMYSALSGNNAIFSIGSYTSGLFFRTGEGDLTKITIFINNSQVALSASGAIKASQWTHVAAVRSGSVVTIYVNGVSVVSGTSSYSIPADTTYVGRAVHSTGEDFNGYLQDVRVYKGVAKYTSNFNPPSSTANATVAAGNDSLVDTPTSYGTDTYVGGEVRGNYATLNPLNVQLGAGSLSNGNLDLTGPSGSSAYNYAGGTFGIDTSTSTGWYFEFTQTTYGQFASIGLLDQSVSASALNNLYIIGHSIANQTAGISYSNGGSIGNYGTVTTGLTSWTSSGDVIGVAIKDNKIWFAKNNTWISGSPSAGTSPSITLASTKYVTPAAIGINSSVLSLNAGQRAFAYTAPSGFKALVDTNLGAPVVAKPNTVMDVVLYTGTGAAQSITGLAFNPDFVWLKRRSSAQAHYLYDVIRGTSSVLYSDGTDAEQSISTGLTSFNSDGFSLGSLSGVNASSSTYVGWAWDAGTSTVSNTAGSITSQVRANASAGFSVVTFNSGGSNGEFSVGHGLGVAPRLIIMKSRTRNGGPWWVHHLSATDTTTKYLQLSTTSQVLDNGGSGSIWGAALPTSTVFGFSVGAGRAHTQNEDIVSYCFAPVVGYSSFGSYTGNGSADGPFVYTGFRPRWLLIKNTTGSNNWELYDAARDPNNVVGKVLLPNTSDAEITNAGATPGVRYDFLSNGFKLRDSQGSVNGSGNTIIFAAFAESPFQYARAR